MFNQDNFNTIEAHNQLYLDGTSTFFTRINSFSDLTFDEFAQVHIYTMPFIVFSFIPTIHNPNRFLSSERATTDPVLSDFDLYFVIILFHRHGLDRAA